MNAAAITVHRAEGVVRCGQDWLRTAWIRPPILDQVRGWNWPDLVALVADELYAARLDELNGEWSGQWGQGAVVADSGVASPLLAPLPPGLDALAADANRAAVCSALFPGHPYLPFPVPTEDGARVLGTQADWAAYACVYDEQVYVAHRAFLAVHGEIRAIWAAAKEVADPPGPAPADVALQVRARQELADFDVAAAYGREAAKSVRDLLPDDAETARSYAIEAMERAAAAAIVSFLGARSQFYAAMQERTAAQSRTIKGVGPVLATARTAVEGAADAAAVYAAMDAGLAAVRAHFGEGAE